MSGLGARMKERVREEWSGHCWRVADAGVARVETVREHLRKVKVQVAAAMRPDARMRVLVAVMGERANRRGLDVALVLAEFDRDPDGDFYGGFGK